MFHGHTLGEINTIESPGVDDLLSVGVDNPNLLALLEADGFAPPGWNGKQRRSWHGQTSCLHVTNEKRTLRCKKGRRFATLGR
jgi:hypothetical protein